MTEAKTCKRWSEWDETMLEAFYNGGMATAEIARICKRSIHAVRQKAYLMGLRHPHSNAARSKAA